MKTLEIRCDGTIFLSGGEAKIVVGNGYVREDEMTHYYYFGLHHAIPGASLPSWLRGVCDSPIGKMGSGLVPFVGIAVMKESSDQAGLWISRPETILRVLRKRVPTWCRTSEGAFVPGWGSASNEQIDRGRSRWFDRIRELESARMNLGAIDAWIPPAAMRGDPDLVLPKEKFGRKIA